MTTRRSLAVLIAVLLILMVGIASFYAVRSQVPATVVSPTSSLTPTATLAIATSTPVPTTTPLPTTPATTRPFALEDRYGWLLPADSAVTSWRVVRETDRATVSTISGDGLVVSPDGRSIAYWSPAGVRRELRVVSSSGGGERLLRVLMPDEVGNAIAWATDGTGLAVGVDSSSVPRGGIDPPPLYSAVRIVEVRDGAVRELIRKAETRLRPFGWVRGQRLVAVAEQAGLGRITAYLRVGEDGAVRVTAFNNPDCSRTTALRLDSAGTTVLSVNPMFCFDGSGAFQGAASVRLWPLDDPSATRTIDLGRVFLGNARFRPGTADVVTVIQQAPPGSAAPVRIQLWSGGAARTIAEQRTALVAEPAPFILRPEGDRALFVWSADPSPATGTRVAWLIDVATGDTREVSPPPGLPHASLRLDP